MWRKLFSRTWLPRILFGVVLVAVFVRLGIWQLDRHDERVAHNDIVVENTETPAMPLGDLLEPGEDLTAADEWTTVSITGRYDPEHELALRLRPIDGVRGVHHVVPLVDASGAALLLDRGLLPDMQGAEPQFPMPTSGEVEVTARLRMSEVGRGTGGDPAQGAIRYLDLDAIEQVMPYPLYGAWGEVVTESPDARDGLTAPPAPETGSGPHLSYALQWFVFAVVGVGGFILLARTETRPQPPGRTSADGPGDDPPPSDDTASGDNTEQDIEEAGHGPRTR